MRRASVAILFFLLFSFDSLQSQTLSEIAKTGDLSLLESFIENNDINECSKGYAPLTVFSQLGELELVRKLLESNADVNVGCRQGKTSLMLAAHFNRIEVGHLLVENGADLQTRDQAGMSALDIAIASGNYDFATEVLKNTINPQGENDGPYLYYDDDNEEITAKWIEGGRVQERILDRSSEQIELPVLNTTINYPAYEFSEPVDTFGGVKKFAALSDIHGQYNVFVKLLKDHHIIDDALNWAYGNGHLVITGDVMDRGENVTEALWLIYKLENQARKKGGKVHMLLGNHELMVFKNDLRYIHQKYRFTSQVLQQSYTDLFSNNSVLGRWLCSKNVIIKLNGNLFMHGGISSTILGEAMSISKINKIFRNGILKASPDQIKNSTRLSRLYQEEGPMWYRGYFQNSSEQEKLVKRTLKRYKAKKIIVGHTSLESILSLYGGAVIGIDSSMKFGKTGELLIYEEGQYLRGLIGGEKVPI